MEPGKNIAIKVPPHQWEDTVAFYRDKDRPFSCP